VNIFAVQLCPAESASDLCDQHIVKMPIETAQMVSTNLCLLGLPHDYKPCYQNHPCTIWARKSYENFNWLISHGLALCYTYSQRYKRVHKSQRVIQNALKTLKEALVDGVIEFPEDSLTPFAQAMPEQYKSDNAIEAYRNYYKAEKMGFARWKHSSKPSWLL